ncbi:MAG: alkane 1-monooxygenase [Acidobacteria bacterium]|nr:alkane 1-monooxygenase [Acidobacteriota bacterium]
MRRWSYLAAFSLPLLLVLSTQWTWSWLVVPLFVFVGIPLLDLVSGDDPVNPNEDHYKSFKNSRFHAWVPRLYALFQGALIIWAVWQASNLTGSQWWWFAISLGLVTGGVGITVAHELGHKSRRLDQWLSQFLLWHVNYMHFFIEHNKGHHAHVATLEDPASARFGESLYRFLPRTLVGGWLSAWRLETKRLKKSGLRLFGHRNAMLWYAVLPQVLALTLGLMGGWKAVGLFYIQATIAVLLLEIINYIEHYGLSRSKGADGRYEKVTPQHSWNATPMISSLLLFQLQRHADHHANPLRPYQTLRHMPHSPQLPAGYASMIPLALVPPLWRRVMHPKIRSMQAGV